MRRYVVFTQILGHKITAAIVDDSILMQSSPDAPDHRAQGLALRGPLVQYAARSELTKQTARADLASVILTAASAKCAS